MKRFIAAVALVAALAVAAPAAATPPPGTDVDGYRRCIFTLLDNGVRPETAVRICQQVYYPTRGIILPPEV